MKRSKDNLRIAAFLGALIALAVAGTQPAPAADPNDMSYVFASAGGPYFGTVGVPIEFDASLSYIDNGSVIEGYYWDWDMDHNYTCFSLPKCTHTWHSAFVGKVRVHVFGPGTYMTWDEAAVTVSGPETILCVVLESNGTDLHVYDPCRRHTGVNPASGNVDEKIPASSFQLTAPVSDTSDSPSIQTIAMPLYAAGDYRIELSGTRDEPFQLSVAALRHGKPLVERLYTGQIAEGERVLLNVCAACPAGQLDMACGELTLSPGLEIEPNQIELTVDPNAVYDVTLLVRETHGKVPLESVTLQCNGLAARAHEDLSSKVSFDLNNFSVGAGSEQEIHARIPISATFQGKATGSITVNCSAGVTVSVPVTVKTRGVYLPVTSGAGSYQGTVGEPVCFDASGCYDVDGYIDQYAWDWDNDGCIDEYSMMPIVCHTWDTEFSGTVTYYVYDNDGHVNTMSVEVTVTEPAAP